MLEPEKPPDEQLLDCIWKYLGEEKEYGMAHHVFAYALVQAIDETEVFSVDGKLLVSFLDRLEARIASVSSEGHREVTKRDRTYSQGFNARIKKAAIGLMHSRACRNGNPEPTCILEPYPCPHHPNSECG